MTHFHEYSHEDLLEWEKTTSPLMRVDTTRDTVLGGLAAAMLPLVVRWQVSSPGFEADDFHVISNVNVGGNPVEGTTWLATVKVPGGAVRSVEFVTAMSKVGRLETEAGHAMLRFIFEDDRRPVILGRDGNPMTRNATIPDLIVSWEAWRPPLASFNPLAGLDPDTYALTARCFNGPARCLLDSILDRPWICYPLKLPGIENAADELFHSALLLADAAARQILTALLDARIDSNETLPSDYQRLERDEWRAVRDGLNEANVAEEPIRAILGGNLRYQLLQRSCITMALQTIDWAMQRMNRRAGESAPRRVRVAPQNLPGFIDAIVSGQRTATLLQLPAALHWLISNQTVVPGRAFQLLDEAGLLEHRRGEVLKLHYDNRNETPYGALHEHVIF